MASVAKNRNINVANALYWLATKEAALLKQHVRAYVGQAMVKHDTYKTFVVKYKIYIMKCTMYL